MVVKYITKSGDPPGIRGYSIVEMMVAITIGLFLSGGIITVYVSSKSVFEHQRQVARLQENERIAMAWIGRDIRNAGYAGCAGGLSAIANGLSPVPSGDLPDISHAIEGVEEDGSAWAPSGSILDASQASRYGDAITIRYMSAPRYLLNDMKTPADPLEPGDTTGFAAGHIAMVTDCISGEIFRITADPVADGKLHHDSGGSPGNGSGDLDKAYSRDAMVGPLVAVRYFVYENENGDLALFRSQIGVDAAGNTVTLRPPAAPETEITGGIDTIQIRYGVDRDSDGIPDSFDRGKDLSAADWNSIVAVQVGLVVNSEMEYGLDRDTRVYNVLGDPVNNGQPFGDRRLRKTVTEIFALRNSP